MDALRALIVNTTGYFNEKNWRPHLLVVIDLYCIGTLVNLHNLCMVAQLKNGRGVTIAIVVSVLQGKHSFE